MRGSEETDRFDAVIDRALRSYAEPAEVPEARVVLARVLSRARVSESQRRGWWVWGAVATAGLAVVVLAGVVWMMRGPRRVEIAGVPKAPSVSQVASSPPQVTYTWTVARTNGAQRNRAFTVREVQGAASQVPKLEVFPTLRPLTAEEQALVAFVRRAPPAVKKAVIEDQQHWDDPIIVADLRKPSLESGSQQDQ